MTEKDQTSQKTYAEVNQELSTKNPPLNLKNFRVIFFNRWEVWVKHYISEVKADGWSDMQAIEALLACLTSWDVEEFETVRRLYVAKVLGEKAPKICLNTGSPEPKIQQYRSKRATLSEFKEVN